MAKLVHEGLHLAETEQCRLVANGFGEVANHLDERAYLLAVDVALLAEGGHPCATALAGPWVHVQIENTHEAFAVIHFVGFHIGMVNVDIGGFHKA